jgi:hypothetical protein
MEVDQQRQTGSGKRAGLEKTDAKHPFTAAVLPPLFASHHLPTDSSDEAKMKLPDAKTDFPCVFDYRQYRFAR